MTLFFSEEEFPEGYKAFCPYCPAAFTNKQELIKHFQEEHDKTPAGNYPIMLCDMCCFVAQNSYTTFKQHREYHRLSVVYKCTRCLYLSSSNMGIKRHARNNFCSDDDLVFIQNSVGVPEKTYSCKNNSEPLTMNGLTSNHDSIENSAIKITLNGSQSDTHIKTDSSDNDRTSIKLNISVTPEILTDNKVTSKVMSGHSKPVNISTISPSSRPVFAPPSHTRSRRVVIPSKRVLEHIVDQTEERQKKLRKPKCDQCLMTNIRANSEDPTSNNMAAAKSHKALLSKPRADTVVSTVTEEEICMTAGKEAVTSDGPKVMVAKGPDYKELSPLCELSGEKTLVTTSDSKTTPATQERASLYMEALEGISTSKSQIAEIGLFMYMPVK